MMKICPRCEGTFAGGAFCPGCGVGQPLLDMSSAEAQPYLLKTDMHRAVQTHYVERSGMVRTALGFAVGADSVAVRVFWLAAAGAWMLFFAGGSLLVARRMARKANEGRPQYVCVD